MLLDRVREPLPYQDGARTPANKGPLDGPSVALSRHFGPATSEYAGLRLFAESSLLSGTRKATAPRSS